jgi:hypothetical protein
MEGKLKYETVQEYLDLYLYPSLQLAVNGLIKEIKKDDFYRELVKEFNQYFFENKAKIIQKEKELIKLERGSDYSDSDYEYLIRKKQNMNETISENQEESKAEEEEEEDFDPDLDDSDMLDLAEQELDKKETKIVEKEEENKFNPIDYLAGFLKSNNLLKNKTQEDFDDVYTGTNEKDEELDK